MDVIYFKIRKKYEFYKFMYKNIHKILHIISLKIRNKVPKNLNPKKSSLVSKALE